MVLCWRVEVLPDFLLHFLGRGETAESWVSPGLVPEHLGIHPAPLPVGVFCIFGGYCFVHVRRGFPGSRCFRHWRRSSILKQVIVQVIVSLGSCFVGCITLAQARREAVLLVNWVWGQVPLLPFLSFLTVGKSPSLLERGKPSGF